MGVVFDRRGGSAAAPGRVAAALALLVACLAAASPARALYFDDDRNFSFRLRAYAQGSMATQGAMVQTDPGKGVGQIVSQRNYANPELDGKLNPYLQKWGFRWLDDLSFRVAGWMFYDGFLDYGPEQYANRAAQQQFHVQPDGQPWPHGAYQTEGYSLGQLAYGGGSLRSARDIYGRRARVNEAYVNISKGPVFFRLGRQAISWGEADTIGLLDANNPFDTTIIPGIFWDLDEARIPLWTARGTFQVFENLGPFSSGFFDTYVVPGSIDNTITFLQMQSASPYSAPPPAGAGGPGGQEVFDQKPKASTSSTRWGVRFQTVIARDYTTSAWFYKTFPTQPVPIFACQQLICPSGRIGVALQHRLTNVIGAATTFFSERLNSIVRAELELFNNEPGFRVATNFAPLVTGLQQASSFDKINVLRGELGFDRNIFIRALNPTNSFIWVTAFVFAANLDETDTKDYRASGILKPSAIRRQKEGGLPAGSVYEGCDGGPGKCDFVNLPPFDWFVQTHLETDYMHGRLHPAVTTIATGVGGLVFMPELTFRVTDSFLLNTKYVNIHTFGSINNGFLGVGYFRDRDQIWLRATYQLN